MELLEQVVLAVVGTQARERLLLQPLLQAQPTQAEVEAELVPAAVN